MCIDDAHWHTCTLKYVAYHSVVDLNTDKVGFIVL